MGTPSPVHVEDLNPDPTTYLATKIIHPGQGVALEGDLALLPFLPTVPAQGRGLSHVARRPLPRLVAGLGVVIPGQEEMASLSRLPVAEPIPRLPTATAMTQGHLDLQANAALSAVTTLDAATAVPRSPTPSLLASAGTPTSIGLGLGAVQVPAGKDELDVVLTLAAMVASPRPRPRRKAMTLTQGGAKAAAQGA